MRGERGDETQALDEAPESELFAALARPGGRIDPFSRRASLAVGP